jgi:hypothetical protein
MEKMYQQKRKLILTSIFLLFLSCIPFLGNAQRLLTEDFDYSTGDLYGQGGEGVAGWVKYGGNTADLIQVVSPSLTYTGYQDQAIGNAVELKATASGQDLQKKFSDEGTGSSNIYVSFLANFKDVSGITAGVEGTFLFLAQKLTSYIDGGSGISRHKVFVKTGSATNKFYIGISRSSEPNSNGASCAYSEAEYDINTTYLVVVKYEIIDETTNDKVSLFVNPVIASTEPTPTTSYASSAGSDVGATGFQAVVLNQGTTATRISPNAIIDAIRVSTTWADLFDTQNPPPPVPSFSLTPASAAFGAVLIGESPTKTIKVKGENLLGDITVTGAPAELKLSATTITKAQAQAENGYDLALTLTPTQESNTSVNLLFESEQLTQKALTVTWTATEPIVTPPDGGLVGNSGFEEWENGFPSEKPVDWDTQLGVTKESAIKKSGNYAVKIQGGTNVLLGQTIMNSAFVRGDIYELTVNYYVLASAGNYDDVQLTCAWGGGNVDPAHDEDKLKTNLYSATENWTTEIIQTSVPKNAASFAIQIKIPANATVIFDDICFKKTDNKEPYMEVSPQSLTEVSTTIHVPVEMQKITITTGNLPSDVDIAVTGANHSYFTLSATTIPVTQTTTELTVTYNPAATGAHTAVLSFDCTGATTVNKTISLKGNAIDPVNPARISIDPASLSFTTEVGKKDTLEVTVTTENLNEWPYARIVGEGPGVFTYLGGPVKNGVNTMKVIFAPTSEGTFSKQLEIYASGVTPAFAELSGTATGSINPPEKEGDSYPLDPTGPLTYLEETFDDVSHNAVLSLTKWKNIAEVNYRAWWGYHFKNADNNITERAAKVTAYNSINTAADPYEMWLITPPLDFFNSGTKWFTFRVMGDLMLEGSDAVLELYYIDVEGADAYKEKINLTDIPDNPDLNGEWREFRIDLTGVQNPANVFFMGFRFAATGGNQNSVVYYIDDVTYGKDFTAMENPIKKDRVWTKDQIIYVSSNKKGIVSLYDTIGMKLGEYLIEAGDSELQPALKRGIYILKIQHDGYSKSYKIRY